MSQEERKKKMVTDKDMLLIARLHPDFRDIKTWQGEGCRKPGCIKVSEIQQE